MTINNPPKYRYSLFEDWDKHAYSKIKGITKTQKYPQIIGTKKEINQFLTTLIRTQKSLHDWRDFLKDILTQIESNGSINTGILIVKYRPESISKEIPDWVTYEEDKIVNDFIDELETRELDFIGNEMETSEFILRFVLGQLGHDWEYTIFMIWEMLGNKDKLNLNDLNNEMKNFDYMRLFKEVETKRIENTKEELLKK